MESLIMARELLRDIFELGDRADKFTANTRLLGELPEFDSLSVVGLIEAAEERLGCQIDEDEITAEAFETVGSFAEFLKSQNRLGS